MSEVERPPLPPYSYRETIKLVSRVQSELTFAVGKELTINLAQHLGTFLAGTLHAPVGNTVDTLLQYLGPFDAAKAKLLAWQLGGRTEELRRGPIQIFWRPTVDQWVPFECRGVRSAVFRRDQPGVEMELFGLGGQPSGVLLKRTVSEGWCRFFAYQVGFSRRTQFDGEARHMMGLQFWLHLRAAQDGDAQIELDAWETSPWMLKRNREIIRLRTRFDVDNGPSCTYDLEIPCFECARTTGECRAAMKAP